MTYETRQELNALSKQVFGTSSRWYKIVTYGVNEPMERDREVLVPSSSGIQKKVVTDSKSVVRHYSVDEVRTLMLDILAKRNPPQVVEGAPAEKAVVDVVSEVVETNAGLPEASSVE
jgi:lipoate-protein ligase A